MKRDTGGGNFGSLTTYSSRAGTLVPVLERAPSERGGRSNSRRSPRYRGPRGRRSSFRELGRLAQAAIVAVPIGAIALAGASYNLRDQPTRASVVREVPFLSKIIGKQPVCVPLVAQVSGITGIFSACTAGAEVSLSANGTVDVGWSLRTNDTKFAEARSLSLQQAKPVNVIAPTNLASIFNAYIKLEESDVAVPKTESAVATACRTDLTDLSIAVKMNATELNKNVAAGIIDVQTLGYAMYDLTPILSTVAASTANPGQVRYQELTCNVPSAGSKS